MNKIGMLIVVIMSMATVVRSQMTDIYLTKDSAIVIDKLYAGVLGGSYFSTDSLYVGKFLSMRAGAMGTYKINKYVEVKSFGMYETSSVSDPFFMHQYWVKILPTKKLNLQVGNMATLMTEQRPHPVSGAGQFETFTESQMPGQALNAKIHYVPTKKLDMGLGMAYRNHEKEYTMMAKYGPVKITGLYEEMKNKFGTALTIELPRVYNTFVWRQDKVVSNILSISLGKDKDYQLYADLGYDLVKEDLVRGEAGILKTFESEYIKGLFGLGYVHETNSIAGYVFIHL